MKSSNNRVHNVRRTIVSNFLTTFLDKHSRKFRQCEKYSKKSSNVKIFYKYFNEEYRKLVKTEKVLLGESNKKDLAEMDVYLDNLDTCEFHYRRDTYKSKFITILKMLDSKYPQVLRDILLLHNFSVLEEKEVRSFLEKIQNGKISYENIVEWFNRHGSKLARSIYIFMLEGKLPGEIKKFFGENPERYGEFTSLDIQKDIELNLPEKKTLQYKLNNIDLNLSIYSNHPDYQVKSNLLDRIFFLHYLTKKSQIELTLWLSEKEKVLDYTRTDRYIGPKEINSGCTTFMGPNKVSIWRKEELPKVILHELIHSLELEQKGNLTEINSYLYRHFDIQESKNKFTFFESYVEIMADITNTFLISQETIRSSNRKSRTLKAFNGGGKKYKSKSKKIKIKKTGLDTLEMFYDLLWIEACWSLFQVAKVLNYFRYHKWEKFYFKNGIPENKKTLKYIQKSNIFSYIIVRSAIFFKLDLFLEICIKHNPRHNLMEHNIPNSVMISFLTKVFSDISYQETINNLLKFMRKLLLKKNVKKDVAISMRMTCLETKF